MWIKSQSSKIITVDNFELRHTVHNDSDLYRPSYLPPASDYIKYEIITYRNLYASNQEILLGYYLVEKEALRVWEELNFCMKQGITYYEMPQRKGKGDNYVE